MGKVLINSKEKPYWIYVRNNFKHMIDLLYEYNLADSKIVVIFDYKAYKYHGDAFIKVLSEKNIIIEKYIIKSSEKIKTLETVDKIYQFLYKNNADKNTVIVSFGGGVIGDIAGFVASTYKRGVKFIQIPTTLVSCADSSIGGKVGVNFRDKKNLIGSFYNPIFVYVNINVLRTLSKKEYRCGMVEVVKHALLMDKDLFDKIESNKYNLVDIIRRSCEIKASVILKDEKENSVSIILNLGHTVGHIVESMSKFKISHGDAVAIGILHSLKVAKEMKKIDEKDADRIERLFKRWGIETSYIDNLTYARVKKYIRYDKKIRDGILDYIILNKIGDCEILKITNYETLFKKS